MKTQYRYVLDGHEPVPCCDLDEWSHWMFGAGENQTRRVALDEVGGFEVSTVFLGIDYRWGMTPQPVLFETMVFKISTGKSVDQRRYSTWDEAEAGHREVCADIRTKQPTPRQ